MVEASPDRVAELLLDVRPGIFTGKGIPFILSQSGLPNLNNSVTVSGGPRQFTATWESDPKGIYVIVDREQRSVTLQGHWWYHGVYQVEPAPQGSRLVFDVYNIAPGLSRWMVPFVARGVRSQQPKTFEGIVTAIGKELGCAAHPTEL